MVLHEARCTDKWVQMLTKAIFKWILPKSCIPLLLLQTFVLRLRRRVASESKFSVHYRDRVLCVYCMHSLLHATVCSLLREGSYSRYWAKVCNWEYTQATDITQRAFANLIGRLLLLNHEKKRNTEGFLIWIENARRNAANHTTRCCCFTYHHKTVNIHH